MLLLPAGWLLPRVLLLLRPHVPSPSSSAPVRLPLPSRPTRAATGGQVGAGCRATSKQARKQQARKQAANSLAMFLHHQRAPLAWAAAQTLAAVWAARQLSLSPALAQLELGASASA